MDAVSSQVTQYFDPFFVSGQFISDRPSVRQIMAQMEQSPATYRFEMSPLYQQVLRDLQYADTVGGETVQGVWLAGVKNNQFIQSNGYVTDASFDITGRIWYQLLKQNPGENIMTPAYTELSTGNLVVTVAIPYNNAAGEMIGVVGLDLSLDTLKEYFSQIKIGENGYITLYDSVAEYHLPPGQHESDEKPERHSTFRQYKAIMAGKQPKQRGDQVPARWQDLLWRHLFY